MANWFLIFLGLLLFGCKKQNPTAIEVNEFKDKYLICDSVKTITNRMEKVEVKGKGTGLDMRLDNSGILTIYSDPIKIYYYGVRYSKIFFWPPNVNMHEGDFYRIISKSEKNLVLQYKKLGTDSEELFYYSIE